MHGSDKSLMLPAGVSDTASYYVESSICRVNLLTSSLGNKATCNSELDRLVVYVAQWKNVGLCLANFPWPSPDLQLMGNHLYG